MNRPANLDELLQGCLNGTLAEGQEQELARLLHDSGEARRALRSYLRIEGGLLTFAKAGSLDGGAPASSGEPGGRTTWPVGPVPHGSLARRRPPRRRVLIGSAVLATTLLMLAGVVVWLSFAPAPSPGPPALSVPVPVRVVEAEGRVEIVSSRGEARPAAVRQELQAGDLLRTGEGNSVAVIELPDKARLELSPETLIRLLDDGAQGVQLIQGVLRGDEAPGKRSPLLVTTPAARVQVVGDRFVVSSISPVSVRVDMEEGKAEVERLRDRKSLTVRSGSGVLVQAAADDMAAAPLPRIVTEPRRVLGFPGVIALCFEPDGRHLLAASCREVQRFSPGARPERIPLSTNKHHGRVARFNRDGTILAAYRGMAKDDLLVLWDVPARQQLARLDMGMADQRLVLAPDASWLATVQGQKRESVTHVWDGRTGERRFRLARRMRMNALAASPDSRLLAVGLVNVGRRDPNHILLVDAVTGQEAGVLPTRAYPLTALAFSPDGRFLAAGINGLVQIWDVRQSELVRSITGFERALTTLIFSPDGQRLAGGTQDGQVWVWDAGRGTTVQVIRAGSRGVRVLAFSPDGRSLATGGIKRQPIMIWDVAEPGAPQPARREPAEF